MINKTIKLTLTIFLALNLFVLVSALTIDNVDQDDFYPGQETGLSIEVVNNFDYNVEDVYLNLEFSSLAGVVQFSPIGSSQDYQEKIGDDDSETFSFNIKASNSIQPGDYLIPYKLSYKGNNSSIITETGSISVHVNSKTSLDFSISQEKPIINSQDKITLKIINKGFGEIKFVTVSVSPSGFTLLSDNKVYIGSIASDDFDTANFNVLLTKSNPTLDATITYKDFENNDKTQTISFDLNAYSQEKALELGLITKSKAPMYFLIVIILVVAWLVYRAIRKMMKNKAKKQEY